MSSRDLAHRLVHRQVLELRVDHQAEDQAEHADAQAAEEQRAAVGAAQERDASGGRAGPGSTRRRARAARRAERSRRARRMRGEARAPRALRDGTNASTTCRCASFQLEPPEPGKDTALDDPVGFEGLAVDVSALDQRRPARGSLRRARWNRRTSWRRRRRFSTASPSPARRPTRRALATTRQRWPSRGFRSERRAGAEHPGLIARTRLGALGRSLVDPLVAGELVAGSLPPASLASRRSASWRSGARLTRSRHSGLLLEVVEEQVRRRR